MIRLSGNCTIPGDKLQNAVLPGFRTEKPPQSPLLIRDNDNKFGATFARVAEGTGIEVLTTPYQAPKANAICERFLGSVRRECLDFGLMLLGLILSERHLYRTMKQYQAYFNHARPHQGINQ